jgi:hypothetical protein
LFVSKRMQTLADREEYGHVHALSRTETEYGVAGVGAMARGENKRLLKSGLRQRAGPSVAGAQCQSALTPVVSTAAVRRQHLSNLNGLLSETNKITPWP